MATSDKAQYDNVATAYKSYDDLPMAKLETELIRTALGDCTSLKVLDLGGGSGTHARQALNAGAKLVDVVDISEGMMKVGKEIETQAGRNQIRWHVADAAKLMAEQGVELISPGSYDVVMANWVFDHAHTVDDLKGMWENITESLKPGGKFLGIRVIRPGIWADYVKDGRKYGCKYENIEKIPGGVSCWVSLMTDPPFSFGGTVMEDSYDMLNEIPKRMGMTDFETVPTEEMEVIKKDRAFWQQHLDEPLFAVVTAKKT